MMRIVFAARKMAKRTRTAATMAAAMLGRSLFGDERGRALDVDDGDATAGGDEVVLVEPPGEEGLVCVERPGGPYLAVQAHRAAGLVVADVLDDHGGASDERRRAGA